MKKSSKYFSLLIALVMMAACAITVNKTLFNHSLVEASAVGASSSEEDASDVPSESDIITRLADGTEIIHTASLEGSVVGYAGPVPLDIYIKDGVITGIEPLDNVETPGFFRRALPLLDNWLGKTPQQALDTKVDAVTGATYSSTALMSNVDAGLSYYIGAQTKPEPSTPWKIWVALAVTLAACILPLFVHKKQYHVIQMIANVAVLGFWCGTFLDYSLMLKYLSSGIALPAGLVAIAMLISAFIYPLFGRPQHYCTHVCPLGSAQQLAGMIGTYKIHLSAKTIKALDWFRRILWAVLMLLLWADCLVGWMDLELFQAFMFESASWGIIAAAIVFVLLSVVVNRPYCRFVCPTGSLFKRAENIG